VLDLAGRIADPGALLLACVSAMNLGDLRGSQALAVRCVEEARRQPRLGMLPVALEYQVFAEFQRGHYSSAALHAARRVDR
jgi:hypothetical protein